MSIRLATTLVALALVAGACGDGSTTTSPSPPPAPEPAPPPSTGCVPTLSLPANGAVLDNGCVGQSNLQLWEFSWSACPDAENYHLWVMGGTASIPFIDNPSLTSNSYRSEGYGYVGDGNRRGWRWRVRSRQAGTWNPWSEERTFDVEPVNTDCQQTGTLPAPVQVAPPDGSVFDRYPRTTTLEWRTVAGASSYTLEVDCYHCCQMNRWCTDVGREFMVERDLRSTSYTFDFVGAQPGRWRVWAVDAADNEGDKSGWWTFTHRQ